MAHLVIEEHKGIKLPNHIKLADVCKKYSAKAGVAKEKDSVKVNSHGQTKYLLPACLFISSPGLKGHVSFSHHFASVVVVVIVCRRRRKLFTF